MAYNLPMMASSTYLLLSSAYELAPKVIYVYKCPDCEVEVEERRKMSQAGDPLDCPLCGTLLVRGITSFMFNSGRAAPAARKFSAHSCPAWPRLPCCYPRTKEK
jgi:putative FmdB family regulatory protein